MNNPGPRGPGLARAAGLRVLLGRFLRSLGLVFLLGSGAQDVAADGLAADLLKLLDRALDRLSHPRLSAGGFEAFFEFLHAAGGVHEPLLAGVERMAGRADLQLDELLGGAGLEGVAAGADDLGV